MPTLWDFFYKSDEKQNSAHYKSCKGCLDEELAGIPIPGDNLDRAVAKRSRFQLGEKFPSSFSNLSN